MAVCAGLGPLLPFLRFKVRAQTSRCSACVTKERDVPTTMSALDAILRSVAVTRQSRGGPAAAT